MTAHTKTLSDSIIFTESLKRAGNNVKTQLSESLALSAVQTSAYKIKRAGDTAFMRSNIPQ
jgi:hypothetical protein